MNELDVSVITPTCGRPQLLSAIGSTRVALTDNDEHIIVVDGEVEDSLVKQCLKELRADPRYKIIRLEGHRSGNPQRDAAITLARGKYLLFLDDDDILVPTALQNITRAFSVLDEPQPLMFSIQHIPYDKRLSNTEYRRSPGHCGSRFVPPNNKAKLGVWDSPDAVDRDSASYRNFHFIEETLSYYPNGPKYIDEVIIIVPSVGYGRTPKEELERYGG